MTHSPFGCSGERNHPRSETKPALSRVTCPGDLRELERASQGEGSSSSFCLSNESILPAGKPVSSYQRFALAACRQIPALTCVLQDTGNASWVVLGISWQARSLPSPGWDLVSGTTGLPMHCRPSSSTRVNVIGSHPGASGWPTYFTPMRKPAKQWNA